MKVYAIFWFVLSSGFILAQQRQIFFLNRKMENYITSSTNLVIGYGTNRISSEEGEINGWNLFMGSLEVSIRDTADTKSFVYDYYQIFSNYGHTFYINGENYFQVTWWKNFWHLYSEVPDTLVVRCKLLSSKGNLVDLGIAAALQDSNAYSSDGNFYSLEKARNVWCDVKLSMAHEKTVLSHFGRLYIIFGFSAVDSENVGSNIAISKISGIMHDGHIEIYDSFNTATDIAWTEYRNDPSRFYLNQNYPNPFNPNTTINYNIPKEVYVTLRVYDVVGKEVAELVNKDQHAGHYQVQFHADNLSSGIYYYKIMAGSFIQTKKMILLK